MAGRKKRGRSDARSRAQPGDDAPAKTTDPERPDPDDSLSPPPRVTLGRVAGVTATTLGAVAAAIAIGVAIYGAVDDDEPTAATVAKIIDVQRRGVVNGVNSENRVDDLDELLRALQGSSVVNQLQGEPGGYGPGQIKRLGDTFAVRFTIRGPKKTLVLHRNTLDADTGQPVPDYDQKVVPVKHPGGTKEKILDIWVPNPPKAGKYFVRTTLKDTAGHVEAQGESDPFAYP